MLSFVYFQINSSREIEDVAYAFGLAECREIGGRSFAVGGMVIVGGVSNRLRVRGLKRL